ncbi:MAG: Gfo/Idh/MocA family oxidoreductase [Chloroflexota bacterium]
MNELRWGILSTAAIGRRKVVPAIQAARRCRVVAVGSRDAQRGRAYADLLGIPTVHDSYAAVLADPAVDAVYIPLPNHLHAEWAIAAARAGKHVLCEKPLAMDAREAEQIVAACSQAGVVLAEAFMYRLHPSWVAIRELVASGRIGELMAVQSWFGYFNDDPANIRNIAAAGGGALYDVGCYCVNLSRLLFGTEPTRVSGALVRDPLGGTDILTSAILEFDDGIASFTCSTRAENDQRVEIYGTKGRISVPIAFNIPIDQATEIQLIAGGKPPIAPHIERLTFPTVDQYTIQAEVFAAAVLDGVDPPFGPEDAVANMRVIDRIFEAARAS